MNLVIVETPAEAKYVADALDEQWQVEACQGMVRDLPVDKLGIDVLHDFQPVYTLLPRKGNLVRRLMRAISKAAAIYIATPPGQIGEVMGWHILALSPALKEKPIYRTPLTALNTRDIQESLANTRPLNMNWVEAYVTERIVDRLTGYLLTPLANNALKSNVAITRAAIVCLHLLSKREQASQSSASEPTWTLRARFAAEGKEFEARARSGQNTMFKLRTQSQADALAKMLSNAFIWVDKTGSRTAERYAPPPYSPATLIADAESRLGITPSKMLTLLETLYESGWISHPNREPLTSMPHVLESVRSFILSEFGAEYQLSPDDLTRVPLERDWIRVTDVHRLPEELPGDGVALYGLIWRRFVASWLAPARVQQTALRILAGGSQDKPFPLEFRAQEQQPLFDGWLRIGSTEIDTEYAVDLSTLSSGTALALKELHVEGNKSEVPLDFTPAGLIEALAANGVHNPASYASTLQSLIDNRYVQNRDGQLKLTQQGLALVEFVEKHFGDVFSSDSSSQFELSLERIAAGDESRSSVLRDFWSHFSPPLIEATQTILHQGDQNSTRKSPTNHPIVLRPLTEE